MLTPWQLGMKGEKVIVRDSYTGEVFPFHRLYAVAYEPRWQKIRSGLTFTSLDGAESTLAQCREYYARSPSEYERKCRVWRILNYANAVPIGQPGPTGLLRVPRETEPIILAFRAEFRPKMKEVGKPLEWDWHTTRLTLAKMSSNAIERDWLGRHFSKLLGTRGNKFRAQRQSKIEFQYYLDLILEALE